MCFVMLTITSLRRCASGSLHKTIWRQSKKSAVRSWSYAEERGAALRIQSVEFGKSRQ